MPPPASSAPAEQIATELLDLTHQAEALDREIQARKAKLLAYAGTTPLDLGKVKVIFPAPGLRSSFDPSDDDDAELLDKLRAKCGRKFSTLFSKIFGLADKKFREAAYRELDRRDAADVIRWLEKPSAPRVLVSTK